MKPTSDSYTGYADVILPLAVGTRFSYGIPKALEKDIIAGVRVVVQFGQGRKQYTALVCKVHHEEPENAVKPLLECLDQKPFINESLRNFWNWISRYYMCTEGEVMHAALPAMLNLSSESRVLMNASFDHDELVFDRKEQTLLNILERNNEMRVSDLLKQSGSGVSLRTVKRLADERVIVLHEEVRQRYKPREIPVVKAGSVLMDEQAFAEAFDSLSRAPVQQKIIQAFLDLSDWENQPSTSKEVLKKELLNRSGGSSAAVKALVNKGLLIEDKAVESRLTTIDESQIRELKKLNPSQERARLEISALFQELDTVLLHGVTSSGKTEVYAHLMNEVLDQGKQVLYLLPEIALTNQLIKRLRTYFGNRIGVYHSRLGQNEQVEVWKKVADPEDEEVRVILGARSSLFLPFDNLGLVIVDEEHDRSFKQQDPAPRYNARDAALVLAREFDAKVLLGSATPSLESLHNARTGKYGMVMMKERFGGFMMPEIEAIDLIEARKKRQMKGAFSRRLTDEIRETLNGGEQVILFRNQRGYAPFLVCDHCSHTPACVNCDVSLTHHKRKDILLCHYCGYQTKRHGACPECHQGHLSDVGSGTERIEEEMAELFPDARPARFDLDSTAGKYAFQRLIDAFENHEIDVLIGTQMVTKGLDFENVGLVGIVNADNLLRFPDFRSFERTFQLLTQVAGRTGRKKKRGKVLIQTYDPFHPVIQRVLESNYKGFSDTELEERHAFKYPPFVRMIEVVVQHRDRQKLYDSARSFGVLLRNLYGSMLLGPEFPRIERLRNYYAMHFILKFDKAIPVQMEKKKLENALAGFTSKDTFRTLKIKIDVDPY